MEITNKMKLLNFTAKNIFSFEEVSLNLDKRGVLLITGENRDSNDTKNSSGKSSISSKGISWVLYGQTLNGLRGDDVKRVGSSEESYGQITFQGRDNSIYRITRYRPSKLVLEKKENNWIDISARIQTETQEKIDSILGKDFRVFSYTDFFGQGMNNTFIQMSGIQKNALFEYVISLNRVNELVEKTKIRRKEVLDKIFEIEKEISKSNGSITEIDNQIRSFQSQQKSIQEAKENLSDELDNTSIEDLVSRLENLLIDYIERKENTEKNISELSSSLNSIISKLSVFRSQKKEIKKNLCPTCNQSINEELFQKLIDNQKDILKNIEELEKKIEEINPQIKRFQNIRLDEMKLILDIEEKLKKAAILQDRENNIKTQELEKRRVLIEELVENLKKEESSLRSELTIYAFWEQAFNIDFRNFLIEKSCPFLETRANIHLRDLGQSQLQIRFSTEKELKSGQKRVSFNSIVRSSVGIEGFDCLSGGEQQFISFAAGLAFSDLVAHVRGFDSNIIILDEPFMFLDELNSQKLVSYITNYLAKIKETVLLISNENSIKDLIPNKINMIKENGVSRVE